MHIEPGVVNGAKIGLSYLTGATAIAVGLKMIIQRILTNTSVLVTGLRCLITTILVFSFFEVLPQYPLGVSEVHFIFGTTLFLFFGAGATAFGLVAGLSLQGFLFAPSDLPQLYINISTLLFPLFAVSYMSKKIIPPHSTYTDLRYTHVLTLTGDNGNHFVSYGTEAGQFQERGYSAVICGPGDISVAHQPDEFIEKSQFELGLSFMKNLIKKLN